MSLTSEIKSPNEPLGRTLRAALPGLTKAVASINHEHKSTEPDNLRPPEVDPSQKAALMSLLGTAGDYAIRSLYPAFDPQHTIACSAFHKWAGPPPDAHKGNGLDGLAADPVAMAATMNERLGGPAPGWLATASLWNPGRPSARTCLMLADLDPIFRAGRASERLTAAPSGLAGRDSYPESWAEDVREQAWLYDKVIGLRQQKVELNPTFRYSAVVGGADGDMLLDGMLVDLKATGALKVGGQMLMQILGYSMLAAETPARVGIYFTRYGRLLAWEPDELAALAGGPPVDELRAGWLAQLGYPDRRAELAAWVLAHPAPASRIEQLQDELAAWVDQWLYGDIPAGYNGGEETDWGKKWLRGFYLPGCNLEWRVLDLASAWARRGEPAAWIETALAGSSTAIARLEERGFDGLGAWIANQLEPDPPEAGAAARS